jgi:hypothetical protein
MPNEPPGVHLGLAHDLGDLIRELRALADVYRLAAERPRLREAFLVQVADDDDRRAEQLRRVRRRETHRARARDVDRGAGRNLRHVGAVVAGREDVREHGEVQDLLERLVPVRELQEVEVRERYHHVLGLAAGPAAHVHVAVGGARPRRVDVEADAGLALLAVPAAAAGDVERHRADVAYVYELDVVALLDDLAGDLVPERLPDRCRRPAAHHVLI